MIEEKEPEEYERQKLIIEVEQYVEELTRGFCREHRISSNDVVYTAVIDCIAERRYLPDRDSQEFEVVKELVENWLNQKLIAKNRETIS